MWLLFVGVGDGIMVPILCACRQMGGQLLMVVLLIAERRGRSLHRYAAV